MKKIALFGCTADPFTVAHKSIVEQTLKECPELTHLVIIPTIVTYHREGKTRWLTDDQRIEVIDAWMSQIKDKRVEIDTSEVDLLKDPEKRSEVESRRFYHTLIRHKREAELAFPNEEIEFYVILGTDSYNNFKTWYNYQEILKISRLIVFIGRDGKKTGFGGPASHVAKWITIEKCYSEVSASAVREGFMNEADGYKKYLSIAKGEDDLLAEEVWKAHLLSTPIFDVVKGPEVQKGFRPIQVKAPDWVAVIVDRIGTNGDRQVLLTKQLRYGTMKEYLEFPCGTVEPGEDPRNAAVRELLEETGYEVPSDKLKFLGNMPSNPAFMTNHIWVYSVTIDRNQTAGETHFDEHEQIETVWKESRAFIMDVLKTMPGLMIGAWTLYEKVRDRYILSPYDGKNNK